MLEIIEGEKMSKEIMELENIIGKGRIIQTPNILKLYSIDKSNFDPEGMPIGIIKVKNTIEIQKIIKFSNKNKISITPCSSGVHFYGRTIPTKRSIVIDLSEMNNIIKIDERNKNATIESGVSFLQLENVKDNGLLPLFPLCPPENKSVLTSYLEREPILVPKLEYYEPILTMEVILPTGEILRTGSAAVMPSKFAEYVVPFGPGLNWNQIFQGAQGTLGIITSATIKIEYLPKQDITYFITSDDLEDLIEPLYMIQRSLLGYECLLLNDLNLLMILESNKSENKSIRQKIPRWILIICLSGGDKLPGEKIKQEEEDLKDCLKEFKIKPSMTLGGLEKRILSTLRQAYKGQYWKLKLRENFQDIFFITTLDKVSTYVKIVDEISSHLNYPSDEIGCYIQPLVRAGACHIEFTFFYDSSNDKQTQIVRNAYEKLIKRLFDAGAFFSRPYGSIQTNFTYQNNPIYSKVLKDIKEIFDPNNIMNPGKLCF